jgi:methylated-DNA-[protein]-cysteine S-methyltransferase
MSNASKNGTYERQIRSGKIVPGMSFNERVWAMTARIPKGKVVTYGDVARALKTKAYRAVGNALNRNPYAPGVPCHRVVGSSGSLTGFAGGLAKKRRMLEAEGVRVRVACVNVSTRFKLRSIQRSLFKSASSGNTSLARSSSAARFRSKSSRPDFNSLSSGS